MGKLPIQHNQINNCLSTKHNEPPLRYQDERLSTWQRLRGNRGSQVDSSKDKGKEKVEESPLPNSKKRKQPSLDHEAGPSRTKIPEAKKQKGFWTRVAEADYEHRRYNYERQRDEELAEALIPVAGAGIYGAYLGTKAIVNGVKKGCNAACRAARNQATRLRERITGTPSSSLTRKKFRHELNSSNRREFTMKNRRYLQIHRKNGAGPTYVDRGRNRNPQHLAQNSATYHANRSAARVRPQVVHRPQYSSSNLSTSSDGADNSASQHKGRSAHSSSNDTSSANSASLSRSGSISSRRRSPGHA
ncbi:uncharacterized protein FA14DRAFT_157082 [Meira miltonrushii]|uniref:Uncharacterized protein n=1 Tax=Meira miltonrushii TaxID=1280837 RepID=A0A316VG16_9BASI|nr:uncharacterized protein FA14DRAFT_157082 [Meira miltonrushii]PWN34425.1 hypothetical protein FA14DRAFT_157082 [Meira miltonrushii]